MPETYLDGGELGFIMDEARYAYEQSTFESAFAQVENFQDLRRVLQDVLARDYSIEDASIFISTGYKGTLRPFLEIGSGEWKVVTSRSNVFRGQTLGRLNVGKERGENPAMGGRFLQLLNVLGSTLNRIAIHPDRIGGLIESSTERWALTPRESSVMRLLLEGLSNKEIAAHLGTRPKTVEHQVGAVMKKSSFTTRSEMLGACLSQAEVLRGEAIDLTS